MTERPEFTADEIEAGRLLFEREWTFIKGVPSLEHLPPADLAEIALAGRSNVGKSSLINALVRQNGLARTSNTPGRTQELIFFGLGPELTLVDMPGYGFAKAPKDKVDAWTELVRDYLKGRRSLARVYLLIDSRHGLKPVDNEILDMLDAAAVSYQVVLTKADQLRADELAERVAETQAGLARRPAAFPIVFPTSSREGFGIGDLRAAVIRLMAERGIR